LLFGEEKVLLIVLIAGDDMDVQVGHLLSTLLAVVDDDIGRIATEGLSQLRIGPLDEAHQVGERGLRAIGKGRIALVGDDEQMSLVDWVDIENDETELVLVEFYTGDHPITDLCENRFHGVPRAHCSIQLSPQKRIVVDKRD
jgi:hypothetical protein